MKQKLKSYLKLGILLFGITFVLVNCQNEGFERPLFENSSTSQVKLVLEKDMPNIIGFLENNTVFSQSNVTNRTLNSNSNDSSVDIESALQVIDTIGNINHTFFLNVADNDNATFYNLVVHENPKNKTPNAYVFKYETNKNHLQDFVDSGYDFLNFEGTVKRYSLNAFLNSSALNTSRSSGVDDCVCEQANVSPSGTSGGGTIGGGYPLGGSTSGGSGEDSGSIACSVDITPVYVIDGEPGNTGDNYDGIAPQVFIGWTITTSCTDGSVDQIFISNRTAGADDDCLNPCEDRDIGETGIVLPTPTPCDRMKELASDTIFKEHLQALKTFATSTVPEANREIAYTRTNDGNYSNVFVGELGADRVDVAVPNPINIHMHTHQPQSLDPDSLPVYSASDLYNIYWLLDNDKITNFKDFALTLVTQNTTYAIRIKSKTAFLAAFQSYFTIPNDTDVEIGIGLLERKMTQYGISPEESDAHN